MKVMGILNVTPDSFTGGGQRIDINATVKHAIQMVEDGADIIDVGGESTRPGAEPVPMDEELARVIPVIKRLKEVIDVPISIDTYKAEVARQAVEAGATIINDVWGTKFDPDMPRVIVETGATVILVHNCESGDFGSQMKGHRLIEAIGEELDYTSEMLMELGVEHEKIIWDPGVGFGKTIEDNMEILRDLHQLRGPDHSILIGASKKGAVRGLMENKDKDLLGIGTIAITCMSKVRNINYVRVHDVCENVAALRVMKNLERGEVNWRNLK